MERTEMNKDGKIPELVREEIRKLDEESEVILFGSRARKDHRRDSDWDFLILLNKEITRDLKNLIRDNLYELELDLDQVISSTIYGKEDWENLKVTLLYQIIQEEGIEI